MDQNTTTLNLPRSKIYKLQSLGKHHRRDLSENILKQLSINIANTSSNLTALDQLKAELSNGCILSYNIELDKVIIDEITSSRIVELTGNPGSGRTQVCFQLSVTTQFPKILGGVEGQVIYVNTNKNFSSTRIRELSKSFIKQISKIKTSAHLTEESILKNIFVFDNNSIAEIFATIKYLGEFLKDKMVKLIIIDSISSPLKDVDFKDRTMLIYKMFEELQHLASIFNFAIVITNDLTIRVKDNKLYYTSSFGDSFFDRVNTRICLTKNNNSNYVAELIKSPVKAPMKVAFCMF